jgi:P27 family predicted phage terminase small subunit
LEKPRSEPPSHLSESSHRWFSDVVGEYALDETGLRLLVAACEAHDRMEEARQILDRDGVTYTDRFGAPRKHPAVTIEQDSRLAFARLARQLSALLTPDKRHSSGKVTEFDRMLRGLA